MGRARRWARLLLAAGLLLAVQGCKWFEITVKIPDFDSRKVQGVWVWKQDPISGQWQRAGQILFDPAPSGTASKDLHYVVLQPDGFGLPLKAPVERDPKAPDQVTVRLWYARFLEPGQYRVSTYNAAGESSLSPEVLDLL